ncbi:hypothetical protein HPB51_023783 [Rhipicephalus microplus]|uniref:Uncharacterized protein n=1 Tax=Rhipicephalus microplus TaxID=6941 RepID=A0A9J6E4K4_RHIMP|nr:hypothetical protein HPB51_023783 [Rhipicephalus microplus]
MTRRRHTRRGGWDHLLSPNAQSASNNEKTHEPNTQTETPASKSKAVNTDKDTKSIQMTDTTDNAETARPHSSGNQNTLQQPATIASNTRDSENTCRAFPLTETSSGSQEGIQENGEKACSTSTVGSTAGNKDGTLCSTKEGSSKCADTSTTGDKGHPQNNIEEESSIISIASNTECKGGTLDNRDKVCKCAVYSTAGDGRGTSVAEGEAPCISAAISTARCKGGTKYIKEETCTKCRAYSTEGGLREPQDNREEAWSKCVPTSTTGGKCVTQHSSGEEFPLRAADLTSAVKGEMLEKTASGETPYVASSTEPEVSVVAVGYEDGKMASVTKPDIHMETVTEPDVITVSLSDPDVTMQSVSEDATFMPNTTTRVCAMIARPETNVAVRLFPAHAKELDTGPNCSEKADTEAHALTSHGSPSTHSLDPVRPDAEDERVMSSRSHLPGQGPVELLDRPFLRLAVHRTDPPLHLRWQFLAGGAVVGTSYSAMRFPSHAAHITVGNIARTAVLVSLHCQEGLQNALGLLPGRRTSVLLALGGAQHTLRDQRGPTNGTASSTKQHEDGQTASWREWESTRPLKEVRKTTNWRARSPCRTKRQEAL